MRTDLQPVSANAPVATGSAERGGQYLTFVLGGETFAAAITHIREIIEYRAPTLVPLMPAYVRGVINLRGRVVPVIDLQVRFGRTASVVQRRTCVVVIETGEPSDLQVLGVLVDAVSAVVEIGPNDIERTPAFGSRLRGDFVRGMGKVGGGLVIILEMDRVLSMDELAMLGEMGAGEIEPGAAG